MICWLLNVVSMVEDTTFSVVIFLFHGEAILLRKWSKLLTFIAKYLNNTKHSRLHVFVCICFWPEAVCNENNLATLVIHSTDNKLIFSQFIFFSYNLQYLTTNSWIIYHSTVYFYMQTVSKCCLQIHSINRHWHSVFKSSVHISVIKG